MEGSRNQIMEAFTWTNIKGSYVSISAPCFAAYFILKELGKSDELNTSEYNIFSVMFQETSC